MSNTSFIEDYSDNEIFNKKENKVFPFHQKYKLLTVGLNGYLVEWDILSLNIKQTYSSGYSIWDSCLSISNKNCIYLSCNDGIIRLINFEKKFYFIKQFSKILSPTTSIAIFFDYTSKKNNEIICSGHLNGNLHKWVNNLLVNTFGNNAYNFNKTNKNTNSNSNLSSIKFNNETNNFSIWKICFISKKFIASGNSNGELQIWDIEFGVLKKSFKEHNGDILAIIYNDINKTLYFTGCDSIIVSLTYFNEKEDFEIQSRIRPQSHDIRSLIFFQNKNILISGGLTTDICLIRLNNGRFLENYGKNNKTKTNSKY